MTDLNINAEPATVDAVLEGGPTDLPEQERRRRSTPGEFTIKIMHRGGYEHFTRDADALPAGPSAPAVYRWTTRTRIAE
jgi:hypothetical protein